MSSLKLAWVHARVRAIKRVNRWGDGIEDGGGGGGGVFIIQTLLIRRARPNPAV